MVEKFANSVNQRLRWEVKHHVLDRSYYLTLMYKYLRAWLSHKSDRETVVINQMGKVGSSTIMHSLKTLGLNINLYHVHALTNERLDFHKNNYRNASRVRGRAFVHNHVAKGIYLRKLLDRNPKRHWKVITLIRDPIARNISTFFEELNSDFFPEWTKAHNSWKEGSQSQIDQMIEHFLSQDKHDVPLVWYDRYFKPVFDIDVYSAEFPKSNGYAIYKNENVELLLMRLEDVNRCAPQAFKEFMNLDDFKIINANISRKKKYANIYQIFINSLKLPEEYIEKMYTSKFANHFYSAEELDSFRSRWMRIGG